MKSVYRKLHAATFDLLSAMGWNVARTADFYSPLPVRSDLRKNRRRWDRPSEMVGVGYDLEAMKELLGQIAGEYAGEYQALPAYEDIKKMGYGPGFTLVDAMTLYFMIRHLKPRRYVEIGSGFSTYYAWLAVTKNREEGSECEMTCIDPFPTGRLASLAGGPKMIASRVEEVDLGFFGELSDGDVLFIDSTHVLKVDGDVAYLYLEVLPRLPPGVVVHAHDIPFPYNTPHPAEQYVFRAKWPLYRTEAMVLQAFLSFNDSFEITLSTPMLRHICEDFLAQTLPGYTPLVVEDYDTHFGSLWLRRVK